MFTMPVIYHSSMKAEDGGMGTLHLNALNGSSGVLSSSSGGSGSLKRNGTFDNLFPPSPKNVNDCREDDNNRVLSETKYSQGSSSLSSLMTPSSTSSSSKSTKAYADSEAAPDKKDFIGSRRSSLDLNAASVNGHRRYDDRSFSLVEVMTEPTQRLSRHAQGPATDKGVVAGLNLTALRISQGIMKSTDYPSRDSKLPALDSRFSVLDSKLSALGSKVPALGSTYDSYDADNKKSHGHSSATAMPGKTRKFLDKITSNTTDYNLHFKQSRSRRESKAEERPVVHLKIWEHAAKQATQRGGTQHKSHWGSPKRSEKNVFEPITDITGGSPYRDEKLTLNPSQTSLGGRHTEMKNSL
ncbi:hypothetical protein BsWGS_16515 [Bradybaena similaris]